MARAEPASHPRPVILLVEDEIALLDTTRMGLEDEFDVETATTAEEANLLLGTRHYDVIICDQLLPGEQGLEFLIRASRQKSAARRILLTGYTNPDLLARATNLAKLSACLLKPLNTVELKKAIRAALNE